MDLGRDLGLARIKNINRTCTQDYIPIKDIVDGVIITTDGRYIQILEVAPIDFALRTSSEQYGIIDAYNGWLKTAPRSFQIKCISRQTRVEEYIGALQNAIKAEESARCRSMAEDHVEFLKQQGRYSSVERHFYLIYSYEPPAEFFRKKDQEEILQELKQKTDTIINSLAAIGNRVNRDQLNDADVAELLYGLYNRLSVTTFPFDSRVERIIKDTCLINGIEDESQLPPADVRDLIAPRSIDTTNPDYIIVDGMYQSHFYICSNGYPGSISPFSWLSSLISFGNGYDVDIFFEKQYTDEVFTSLKRRRKYANIKMGERTEHSMDYEMIGSTINSMEYLISAITSGEDIYEMVVMVTIHAYTLEELYQRRKILLEQTSRVGIRMGDCTHFEEEAFFSTGPYNDLSARIYNKSHQNLTSSAVAASYPYTNFALTDKGGVLLGMNAANNSLVLYNNFDTSKYANANLTIFGASGQGKTYTLLSLTSRLRYHGVQTYILAPDKQIEFLRICDEVDGLFVDMSTSSKQRINPFDIWPKVSADSALLDGSEYLQNTSWLLEKVENLKIWFQYLQPDITSGQKALLGKSILAVYRKKGITEENDSIYLDKATGRKKEMPIISDLIEELKKEPRLADITDMMTQFTEGAAQNLNGQTNVDLENKYIVFGLENLKGDLQAAIMYIVLEYIWSVTRSNRTKKKIIAIDEGWKLLDPRNPQVADFVVEIFKVIRGFGGGAIFATQSLLDLYRDGSTFGNAIIANSHSNILLGMTEKESDCVSEELGLSDAECQRLKKFHTGEALLCAGQTHIPIYIRASKREHAAFTTKRSDLEAIARQRRKEENAQ